MYEFKRPIQFRGCVAPRDGKPTMVFDGEYSLQEIAMLLDAMWNYLESINYKMRFDK